MRRLVPTAKTNLNPAYGQLKICLQSERRLDDRCPGAQVALHETRIFLERMFKLPGIRMEKEPIISWNPQIQGYELRGCIVACDPA